MKKGSECESNSYKSWNVFSSRLLLQYTNYSKRLALTVSMFSLLHCLLN